MLLLIPPKNDVSSVSSQRHELCCTLEACDNQSSKDQITKNRMSFVDCFVSWFATTILMTEISRLALLCNHGLYTHGSIVVFEVIALSLLDLRDLLRKDNIPAIILCFVGVLLQPSILFSTCLMSNNWVVKHMQIQAGLT